MQPTQLNPNELLPDEEVIGLPLDDTIANPPSILLGLNESDYVELLNPLSIAFRGIAAQTVPVTHQMTESERVADEKFGVGMRQGGKQDIDHVRQAVIIRPGQSIRLPGHVGQVVGRQLVNTLMQQEGNKGKLADPVMRREYEDRIVLSVGKVNDILSASPESLGKQIGKLNNPAVLTAAQEPANEQPFPTELQSGGYTTEADQIAAAARLLKDHPLQSPRRNPGRAGAA